MQAHHTISYKEPPYNGWGVVVHCGPVTVKLSEDKPCDIERKPNTYGVKRDKADT